MELRLVMAAVFVLASVSAAGTLWSRRVMKKLQNGTVIFYEVDATGSVPGEPIDIVELARLEDEARTMDRQRTEALAREMKAIDDAQVAAAEDAARREAAERAAEKVPMEEARLEGLAFLEASKVRAEEARLDPAGPPVPLGPATRLPEGTAKVASRIPVTVPGTSTKKPATAAVAVTVIATRPAPTTTPPTEKTTKRKPMPGPGPNPRATTMKMNPFPGHLGDLMRGMNPPSAPQAKNPPPPRG